MQRVQAGRDNHIVMRPGQRGKLGHAFKAGGHGKKLRDLRPARSVKGSANVAAVRFVRETIEMAVGINKHGTHRLSKRAVSCATA
ncbi:hypothetical protein GCM10022228_14700 [Halomonas cibimaris]|uniref:Uncharacterized protein n=1 Tax=Halomonas cibimaris TaxID=657012 RepID=A0ABP7LNN4_9GAMM